MEVGEVMVMVVLRARDDDWHRPLDVDWTADVARHWDVLFLDDGHMSDLLHEHGNLLLDGYLLHFTRVPVAHARRRPGLTLVVVLALHASILLAHDRFRWGHGKQRQAEDDCLDLRRAWEVEWFGTKSEMIYYYRHQKANFFASAEAISHHFQHFFSLALSISVASRSCCWSRLGRRVLSDKFIWFPIDIYTLLSFSDKTSQRKWREKKREKLAIFNLSWERLQSVEQRSSGAITSRCLGFFLLLLACLSEHQPPQSRTTSLYHAMQSTVAVLPRVILTCKLNSSTEPVSVKRLKHVNSLFHQISFDFTSLHFHPPWNTRETSICIIRILLDFIFAFYIFSVCNFHIEIAGLKSHRYDCFPFLSLVSRWL